MNALSTADLEFACRFASGALPPGEFDHTAHLRLAYVHLATHGPEAAVATFRDALVAYLRRHQIDAGKFHETLTQAWLRAVWHFMQRAGDTSCSADFLHASTVLQDPRVMLTHYSREVLFSEAARSNFVEPDIEAIPRTASR